MLLNNGKCNSKLFEYKNCGAAFCFGDEHEPKGFVNVASVTAASAFSCLRNCGWATVVTTATPPCGREEGPTPVNQSTNDLTLILSRLRVMDSCASRVLVGTTTGRTASVPTALGNKASV